MSTERDNDLITCDYESRFKSIDYDLPQSADSDVAIILPTEARCTAKASRFKE